MKKLLLFSFLLISFASFPQLKSISLPTSSEADILYVQDWGDNGVLLKTGAKGKNLKLSYYSQDLNLVWEKPIETQMRYSPYFKNAIVGANDGSYVYHLENTGGYLLTGAKTVITQIDKLGSVKTKLIDTKAIGSARILISDKNNVYILDGGKTTHTDYGNYHKMKWKMMVIDHKTLTPKTYELMLPEIPKGRENGAWKLVGMNEGNIYLYSNRIDLKGKTSKVVVAEINSTNGNVLPKEIALTTNGYLGGCQLSNYPSGSFIGDFSDKNTIVGKTTGGAFCGVKLDSEGNFILYGLLSRTGFVQGKTTFDGCFVHKYDKSGKQLWKTELDAAAVLKENSYATNGVLTTRPVDLREDGNDLHYIVNLGITSFHVKVDIKTGEVKEEFRRVLGPVTEKGISEYAKAFKVDLVDLWDFLHLDNVSLTNKIMEYSTLSTGSFYAVAGKKTSLLVVTDSKGDKVDLFQYKK